MLKSIHGSRSFQKGAHCPRLWATLLSVALVISGFIVVASNALAEHSTTTPARASAAQAGTLLVNVNSGKCLEIGLLGTSDFNVANQYTCTDGASQQQWVINTLSPNVVTLRNAYSGKCLEIGLLGTWDFNVANQYTCVGGAMQQQWRLNYVGPGQVYTLSNQHSGKCLEIGFSGTWDFNVANQYTCHGGPNQQWRLAPA